MGGSAIAKRELTKSNNGEEECRYLQKDSSDDDKVYGRAMQELPPVEWRWFIDVVYVVLVREISQDEVQHTCNNKIMYHEDGGSLSTKSHLSTLHQNIDTMYRIYQKE